MKIHLIGLLAVPLLLHSFHAVAQVTGDDIVNNTITSADIRNSTITNADIRNNTITSADIKNNAITNKDIRDNTINSADIKNNSITSVDIRNGEIKTRDIENGAVTSSKLSQALRNGINAHLGSTCQVGEYVYGIDTDGTLLCEEAGGSSVLGSLVVLDANDVIVPIEITSLSPNEAAGVYYGEKVENINGQEVVSAVSPPILVVIRRNYFHSPPATEANNFSGIWFDVADCFGSQGYVYGDPDILWKGDIISANDIWRVDFSAIDNTPVDILSSQSPTTCSSEDFNSNQHYLVSKVATVGNGVITYEPPFRVESLTIDTVPFE